MKRGDAFKSAPSSGVRSVLCPAPRPFPWLRATRGCYTGCAPHLQEGQGHCGRNGAEKATHPVLFPLMPSHKRPPRCQPVFLSLLQFVISVTVIFLPSLPSQRYPRPITHWPSTEGKVSACCKAVVLST